MRLELEETPINFQSHECVANAGVLFLLPFLKQSGLLSYDTHYKEISPGYYYLRYIIILLSFMYLLRIKNPEQLKYHSPGELGKIMGIDRVPEARCLRGKIQEIVSQGKSRQWNMELANTWSGSEDNEFYYIDGHVQVYSGYKGTLGKKHVARQKLCLPGMQEFWVNNKEGLPYFYVCGQVNEKLLEMLSSHILPDLLNEITQKYTEEDLALDLDLARFTIVFDREGFSPVYYGKIWQDNRVAVLTYRKNVKDQWPETDFINYPIVIDQTEKKMLLAEHAIELDGVMMREVRRLKDDHHQSSIITTNRKLSMENVALHMFSRWTQENFFKYLRQEFAFDRMCQYGIESIDGEFKVANPDYTKLNYRLKKEREKISRCKANLYEYEVKNFNDDFDNTRKYINKIAKEKEKLDIFLKNENDFVEQRKLIPCKIKVKDMTENIKYNKLQTESKYFMNIIKMICYRAETGFANHLSKYYKKETEEKRALVKSIILQPCDIIPDYEKNTLSVNLYTLPSQRMNIAVNEICKLLNETETIYPGSNLVLLYKLQTL
jgi:hypothetical protein